MRRSFVIDQRAIDAYARATGDVERVHLDREFAKRQGHPDSVGHGGVLFAFVELMLGAEGLKPERAQLRFQSPFYNGDTVVVDLDHEADLAYAVTVRAQGSERLIATGVVRGRRT